MLKALLATTPSILVQTDLVAEIMMRIFLLKKCTGEVGFETIARSHFILHVLKHIHDANTDIEKCS